MSSPRTETPRTAVGVPRRCRTILKPGEHALVRLAIAGLAAADAGTPGSSLALAGALIELRHAAAHYRKVLEAQ